MTLQSDQPARNLERDQWLPPRGMRHYAIARAVGGLIFAVIFVGWIVIQWSNPTMRVVGGVLVVVTAWVTVVSIVRDAHRAKGRQITAKPGVLEIVGPASAITVRMAEVGEVKWEEQTSERFGLWFYDREGGVLAHLDGYYLDGQAEARTFMGWVLARMEVPCKVTWPGVEV